MNYERDFLLKIFDINSYTFTSEKPVSQNETSHQVPKELQEKDFEELVQEYLTSPQKKYCDGTLLNNSDTELINNHLEQYLPSASLRLEIQIERLSSEFEKIEKHLQALKLLPDSDIKTNQFEVLMAKKLNIAGALNFFKEEYRQISPIHKFSLWLKDKISSINGQSPKNVFKSLLYGDKAAYLSELEQSKTSMELLVNQVSSNYNLPGNDENNFTLIEIIKQFEKLETDVDKIKQKYTQKEPLQIVNILREFVQKHYYGYIIPEESYNRLLSKESNKQKQTPFISNGLKMPAQAISKLRQ